MKAIKVYSGDSFEFHKEVVANKKYRPKDPTYKDRIIALTPTIKELFKRHDQHFENDTLARLVPERFSDDQQMDLESLYKYSTTPFIRLKTILTTDDNGCIQPLCPFCTINNANTLDHLIPKAEFPEFSDNPKNLMPCCSECNGLKSTIWRENTERKYLNLYLDDLPEKQFLFVRLTLQDGAICAKYFLENREEIDNKLFTRIANHYDKLCLCKRFSKNSENIVSELKFLLNSCKEHLPEDTIKDIIYDYANKERKRYGWNYWKAILIIECCNNNIIFNHLLY